MDLEERLHMNKWYWRTRSYVLALSASGLLLAGGCALSDQELAQVWESVISSALSTIISNALTLATGVPTA
jgi:hypothetical protein